MNMIRGGMMYSKGDIVVINFPYSDFLDSKKRPAVILAEKGNDILVCSITSNLSSEGIQIKEGTLPLKSKIKYWRIHALVKNSVLRQIAKLDNEDHSLLISKINELIKI